HAAAEAALGQLGEEALDGVEPGGRGRGVMEGEAWMAPEPSPRLGMLVRAVVVEDHVNDLARRDLGLDSVQEADEFLCRCRCMQRPITLPSSTSNAANSVVVPFLL